MNYIFLFVLLFGVSISVNAQALSDLEKLNLKSNKFTEFVMSRGTLLYEKIAQKIVPNSLDDFNVNGSDSLALQEIKSKSLEYYDYLVDYQKSSGVTMDYLASIFINSAAESSSDSDCFKNWYTTEGFTVAITLACYQTDNLSVKESCIARSIHAMILNNANIAECFKTNNRM